MSIRPIDLLRKIGNLTTPAGVNMASLSASWATRRYFWAIAEPQGTNSSFRLSLDARAMDFHQKTLLSDEFGIGFAGLVLGRLFDAPNNIDVSAALNDPVHYQNVDQTGSAQPDYLMWNAHPSSPYYVVECKGCQTSRKATMNQIRRGLEQVPSLVFGAGSRTVVTLVVATHMQAIRTTIYIVDPPSERSDELPDEPKPQDSERVSERIGKSTWRILRRNEFATDARLSRQAKLLNWAGQFASAARISPRTRGRDFSGFTLPDLDPQVRTFGGQSYYGRHVPLFPELGSGAVRVFAGVRGDFLKSAVAGAEEPEDIATDIVYGAGVERQHDPNVSVGRDGTCLSIEGL